MRLEYRLTLNDYLAAMEADGKVRNPWLFKSSLLWCATICGIISALISMFFDITFSIYMFLGAIFISPPIFKRFYRWQLSGHFKNDPRLNECLTVDLDENTIKFASDNSISKIKWEGFYHFIEADNVFNFYTSKITYHIIPKRAFINSEKLDIFRNIVVKKINNDCQFFSSANITIKRKYFYISGCAIFLAIVAIAIGTAIFDKGHYYWLNEGNDLYAAKRYEEALDSYKKALDIDPAPGYPYAWKNRGDTLQWLNRYEEALASYDKALEIDPEYVKAWSNRGLTLRKLKRYKEAVASHDKALDIDPEYPYAWNGRGFALEKLERYEEALVSYNKALEIDPNYKLAINNRQRLLTELGLSE